MKKIKLGQRVRDKYTGFTGLVVSRTEHLYGPTMLDVEPGLDNDGDFRGVARINEGRVEPVVDDAPHELGFDK